MDFVVVFHLIQFSMSFVIVAMIISWFAMSRFRKKLSKATLRASRIVKVLAILAMPLSMSPAMDLYRMGRDQAYAGIDCDKIMQECRELHASMVSPTTQPKRFYYVDYGSDQPKLPTYMASLNPRRVVIEGDVAVVQMFGDGAVFREGLLVLLGDASNGPQDFARTYNLKLLDAKLPVYRFYARDIGPDKLLGPESP